VLFACVAVPVRVYEYVSPSTVRFIMICIRAIWMHFERVLLQFFFLRSETLFASLGETRAVNKTRGKASTLHKIYGVRRQYRAGSPPTHKPRTFVSRVDFLSLTFTFVTSYRETVCIRFIGWAHEFVVSQLRPQTTYIFAAKRIKKKSAVRAARKKSAALERSKKVEQHNVLYTYVHTTFSLLFFVVRVLLTVVTRIGNHVHTNYFHEHTHTHGCKTDYACV